MPHLLAAARESLRHLRTCSTPHRSLNCRLIQLPQHHYQFRALKIRMPDFGPTWLGPLRLQSTNARWELETPVEHNETHSTPNDHRKRPRAHDLAHHMHTGFFKSLSHFQCTRAAEVVSCTRRISHELSGANLFFPRSRALSATRTLLHLASFLLTCAIAD